MRTTERECLGALREAADRLDESPTKAQYEELGLTPASATILRVMGGWNAAKEAAGLETYDQDGGAGPEPEPKPEGVEIPPDEEWTELTGQQRWYYKNREERIARKDRRREELRAWLYRYKRDECECSECGEGHPGCLEFHHPGEKELGISRMVTHGYSRERIGRRSTTARSCVRTATDSNTTNRRPVSTMVRNTLNFRRRCYGYSPVG